MLIKRLRRSAMIIAAVFFLSVFFAQSARADSVTDTIEICIGYFGWAEDEYVSKITYHWSDLDDSYSGALDTSEVVYSYYSGSRTYLAAARGFKLRDLLEYAGVDLNSIARLDFFTKDQTVGAYRSFTRYSILDMPRYYFPNLSANEETGEIFPWDGDDIWNGATQVETMLALEDYTEWDAVGSDFQNLYTSDMFSPSSRFHLFFGQADPTEANTSSAAKYVYKIFVTFAGSPVLSTDSTNIELKVGSDFSVPVNISAEDSLLDGFVADNLVWSSSDESVVRVDNSGKLTVISTGTAVITATFGESSVSVTVSVSSDNMADGSGTGPGEARDAPPAESISGTGQSENSENELPTDTAEPVQTTDEAPDTAETAVSERGNGVYVLSSKLMSQDEYAQWVNRVLSGSEAEEENRGALPATSNTQMSDDSQQLILLMQENPQIMVAVSAFLAAFFVLGFTFGVLRFKSRLKK